MHVFISFFFRDVDNRNSLRLQAAPTPGMAQQQAIAAVAIAQRHGPFKHWPGFVVTQASGSATTQTNTTLAGRYLSHSAG